MTELMVDHERLDVYRLAIDYAAFSYRIARSLSGVNRHVRDPWLRAAQSIPRNIAEGNGRQSLKDKNRFVEIARDSAWECAAIHDMRLAFRTVRNFAAQAASLCGITVQVFWIAPFDTKLRTAPIVRSIHADIPRRGNVKTGTATRGIAASRERRVSRWSGENRSRQVVVILGGRGSGRAENRLSAPARQEPRPPNVKTGTATRQRENGDSQAGNRRKP